VVPDAMWFRHAGLSAVAGVLLACGGSPGENDIPEGLAACGPGAFLTVAPADPALVESIAPLGVVEPSGHVFPSDHVYLYPVAAPGGGRVLGDVRAPGDIIIRSVLRVTRTGGGGPDVTDYAMRFFPCADVFMYFGHVLTLAPDIVAQVGSFTSCDPPQSIGGYTYVRCEKVVEIPVRAGGLLGTYGGALGFTLDYGGYDRRVPEAAFVDPARSYGSGQDFGQNRTICPLDYFVPAVAAALRAKLGGNGKVRTAEPICGTIMQDLANTAQGRWYFDATPQEDPHLALIHDNVDPSVGLFSIGTSIPSLPTSTRLFVPATTGRVNRDFPGVTPDGVIYCYQNFTQQPPPPFRHILLQLTAPATVRIEGVLGTLCGDPSTWSFTAGARNFSR